MPSLRIRDCSVERFMPNRAAAPAGPLTTGAGFAEDAQDVFALGGFQRRIAGSFDFHRRFQFSDGNRKFGAARKDDGAFDDVFEFAHIAGPVIVGECVHCFRLDAFDRLLHPVRELLREKAGEQRDVFATLAQRRNRDGENVQLLIAAGLPLPLRLSCS